MKVLKFRTFDEKRARTYGNIAGFWVITQKSLLISEI
jgi:hypothetical protein